MLMRNPAVLPLVLLLLGIVLGASGATIVVNTLNRRDAYARGVMNVMQHNYALLRQNQRQNHCDAQTNSASLGNLREFADGLEQTFYAEDAPDPPFLDYSQRLHDAIATASGADDCKALMAATNGIGAACDACHRQYR
jgi:cytochrome c556